MIADLQVSLAQPSDAQQIAELSRVAIEYGLVWKWTPSRVLKYVRDRSTNVAVAREGNMLVGFAIMKYKEQEAHLLLFAVRASHRRMGVGSALLSWLEVTVQTAGIGVIQLEARTQNTAAREFYRGHGYQEIAIIKRLYGGIEDGVRMAKDLWSPP